MSKNILDEYIEITQKYKQQYGSNTLLLYQVGSFFEIYAIKHNNQYFGSDIQEICQCCDLLIANKKMNISKDIYKLFNFNKNDELEVKMAGFRDYSLDKYLKKCQEVGYTVVIYRQDIDGKNTTRSLDKIVSPGTYFPDESQNLSNHIICFFIEREKDGMYIGTSIYNTFTGKLYFSENKKEKKHCMTTYDDCQRMISIYNPNECIFLTNMTTKEMNEILSFSQSQAKINHLKTSIKGEKYFENELSKLNKQTYLHECIKQYFQIDIDSFLLRYEHCQYATKSFCYLLDFIAKHDIHLLKKIKEPEWLNEKNEMILFNHSLKQLNIISSESQHGKFSSLSSLLNHCITPMGKREFHQILVNPITNIETLEKSYQITHHSLSNDEITKFIVDDCKTKLMNCKDIEKIKRRMVLKTITPVEIIQLYDCFLSSLEMDKEIKHHFRDCENEFVNGSYPLFLQVIEKIFNIEKCREISTLLFDSQTDLFQKGVFTLLDEKKRSSMDSLQIIHVIHEYFNKSMEKYEKKSASTTDFVKLHETEKSGYTFQTTKRRSTILKMVMEEESKKNKDLKIKLAYISPFDEKEQIFDLNIDEIEYNPISSGSMTVNISNPQLKQLFENVNESRCVYIEECKKCYFNMIDSMITKYNDIIDMLATFISQIDVLRNKVYIASNYHYSRPIVKSGEKSSVRVKGLRHPIIERMEMNEIYVSNDIELNHKDCQGILLYGTNAVGKTSLIKSLGMAVCMAQAGLYVPCQSMEFIPYHSIFTRILNTDDMWKGLSTFAVEMLELRMILNMCDEKSLILGDELCSGTENDSALSIFAAGCETLYKRDSHFLFATHMHELPSLSSIVELERLKMKHMSVRYCYESDEMIYDRVLRDGQGCSMYGLEVCKSLHLPMDFIERSREIRDSLPGIKQKTGITVLSAGQSSYNSEKIKQMCEVCNNNVAVEVHHLLYQKNANKKGMIEKKGMVLNKDNKANLVSICERCHDKIHKEKKEMVRRNMGGKYRLEIV